jgi:UDP-glucose 4-epimerase
VAVSGAHFEPRLPRVSIGKPELGGIEKYPDIVSGIFDLQQRGQPMRVLVTGGAGYIGSVVVEELLRAGHNVVVYDNLSEGHRASVPESVPLVVADLIDTKTISDALRQHAIEVVIHMAASALVGESVAQPAKYYRNNVIAGLSLLDAMISARVNRLVFSSTAAVYGEPRKFPIEEDDPTEPTNPYGETKLVFESALRWYKTAHDINYVSLRYFNAAGATERCGELHNPETHLIPIVLNVAAGQKDYIEIFGDDYETADGTCVRDYIHVIDLARAHTLALDVLSERSAIYNLGCGGAGYSVKEVVELSREITGKEIPVKVVARRAGDPAVLIASSEKIKKELNWTPELQDLSKMIESAWRWQQNNRQTYDVGT